jgi:hypothetical protein
MSAHRRRLLVLAVIVCSALVRESGSTSGTDLPPGTIQLHGGRLHVCRPAAEKVDRSLETRRNPAASIRAQRASHAAWSGR